METKIKNMKAAITAAHKAALAFAQEVEPTHYDMRMVIKRLESAYEYATQIERAYERNKEKAQEETNGIIHRT